MPGAAMIWIYRHTLSPLVGYNCRHLPTCSVYGDEAIERFGLWGGGWMTLARLLRCQPWGTSGIDNVPLTRPPGARWYLPWRFGRWRGVNAPICSASAAAAFKRNAHCCHDREPRHRERIGLMLPLGGTNNALENQPPSGHDPRQIDLVAILALLIIIVAACRLFQRQPRARRARRPSSCRAKAFGGKRCEC